MGRPRRKKSLPPIRAHQGAEASVVPPEVVLSAGTTPKQRPVGVVHLVASQAVQPNVLFLAAAPASAVSAAQRRKQIGPAAVAHLAADPVEHPEELVLAAHPPKPRKNRNRPIRHSRNRKALCLWQTRGWCGRFSVRYRRNTAPGSQNVRSWYSVWRRRNGYPQYPAASRR